MAFRFSSAKAAVMMACLLLAAMSAICQSLFPACAEMLCGSVKRVVLRRRFAGCSLALAVQLCLVEFASANKVCGGGSIPSCFDDAARKERCKLFQQREKRVLLGSWAVLFRNGLTKLRGKRDLLSLQVDKGKELCWVRRMGRFGSILPVFDDAREKRDVLFLRAVKDI